MSITLMNTLETVLCYSCGIQFAVPAGWQADRINDHKDFWCPNGHRQHYQSKTDAEIEREKRIRAEARAARWEDAAETAERRRRAEKAQKTKVLNRIKNGVCPFCNRHFDNVEAHMQTQHAEERLDVGSRRRVFDDVQRLEVFGAGVFVDRFLNVLGLR